MLLNLQELNLNLSFKILYHPPSSKEKKKEVQVRIQSHYN